MPYSYENVTYATISIMITILHLNALKHCFITKPSQAFTMELYQLKVTTDTKRYILIKSRRQHRGSIALLFFNFESRLAAELHGQ